MTTALLWWLSGADIAAIGETLPPSFPAYIRREYSDRHGRAGRGNLWVAPEFGQTLRMVTEDHPMWKTPLGRFIEANCGGVAIHATDAWILSTMPGILTDALLRRREIERAP